MTSSFSVARRIAQLAWVLLWFVFSMTFFNMLADGCATTHAISDQCRQQLTPALETKVSDALDLEAFEDRLEQLVAASSLCAVNALLQPLAASSPGGAGGAAAAAVDTLKALRAQRARQWLQKHPALT